MITTIVKSAFGGSSLSFIDRKAVFIPLTIPGETVELGEIKNKKDYCQAQAVKIISPSPDRIDPECPNFGRCGGCDYLHMSYNRELEEKRLIIKDSLLRVGKFSENDIPAIDTISAERFFYRSHVTVKHSRFKKGFYSKESHEIVLFPAEGCLLVEKDLFHTIMKSQLKADEYKGSLDRHSHPHVDDSTSERFVEEEAGGIIYRRGINSFFQANRFLRKSMIDRMIEYAAPGPTDKILELGCGCGFFTLHLASRCASIHGIDISKESITNARFNAEKNCAANASFSIRADESIDSKKDSADIILADPPRAGLSKRTCSSIAEIAPERIIYISCNPSTWARDLRIFTDKGYSLSKITFIDMFPATQHIEVISLLSK